MDCWRCGLPVEDGQEALRHRTFKGIGGPADEELPERLLAEHMVCKEERRKGQRVKITAYDGDFTSTSVRLIQPDGTEIPFQDIVRAVTIRMEEGDLNTATVVFEGVECAVNGFADPASEPVHNHV